MVPGLDPAVLLALALSLGATFFAVRAALRWGDWRLIVPVAAIAAVCTGPAIELAREGGVIDAAMARQMVLYRWVAITALMLAAIFVAYRLVERERRLFDEIATTEQRFRSISRVLPVGVFQADLDGRCIYANDVALSMIGIKLGDAIGEGWIRRLHPDDRDRVMEQWQAASLEGRDFRSEYRFRKTDGEVVWVLGHVLALKDADGDVIGHVGAITDITERKRYELALQQARENLEQRVVERTGELTRANRELEREIENRRRAETAAEESESRLQAILDNTPAHIFIKDLKGRYVYINRPQARADDVAVRTSLVGRTDAEVFTAEAAASLAASDRQVVETGAAVESEDTLETRAGPRTFFTVKFPLRSTTGEIYAVAGVSTDITRRAALTEAVRRIFALSPVGMCTLDREGRFQLVNDGFARILGYDREEIAGHRYEEFLHPDDRAATRERGRRLLEGEEGVAGYENRYRNRAGNYRLLSWQVSYAETDGLFYAACTDVTEASSQNRAVRQIYDLAPVLMCRLDWDRRFTAVNPVYLRTFGYTEGELLGRSYLDFLHPDDHAAALERDAQLRSEEATVTGFELRTLCKDGTYRLISWDASSSPADEAFYCAGRDVTEVRRLERQLEERRDEMAHLVRLQTMGEMASEIAHELNQPLSAIVNYARGAVNRLRDKTTSDAEMSALLEKIAVQALRGGDIIRRMRDFVRRSIVAVDDRDLNELVRDAVTLLSAGGHAQVPIHLALSQGLPEIRVDGVQIEQVILNLARNAIDAVAEQPDGALSISTETLESGEIRLSVSDNGPGLRDHDTERIFEAFYTTKDGGLGLGLPISRTIVQAHGGRLWAESTPGRGTTFVMTLPVTDRAAA